MWGWPTTFFACHSCTAAAIASCTCPVNVTASHVLVMQQTARMRAAKSGIVAHWQPVPTPCVCTCRDAANCTRRTSAQKHKHTHSEQTTSTTKQHAAPCWPPPASRTQAPSELDVDMLRFTLLGPCPDHKDSLRTDRTVVAGRSRCCLRHSCRCCSRVAAAAVAVLGGPWQRCVVRSATPR